MTNPWHYFRTGYRRIKRFVAWVPILWKDEDWDYIYFLEVMRFKISRIRKEIDKNKRHIGYKKQVKQMKVVEELLSRIAFNKNNDFYIKLSEQLRNFEKQGKCICPEETFGVEPYFNKAGKKIGSTFIDLSCFFCKKALSRWLKQEQDKENADLEFLFKHLKKHVKKWWD